MNTCKQCNNLAKYYVAQILEKENCSHCDAKINNGQDKKDYYCAIECYKHAGYFHNGELKIVGNDVVQEWTDNWENCKKCGESLHVNGKWLIKNMSDEYDVSFFPECKRD